MNRYYLDSILRKIKEQITPFVIINGNKSDMYIDLLKRDFAKNLLPEYQILNLDLNAFLNKDDYIKKDINLINNLDFEDGNASDFKTAVNQYYLATKNTILFIVDISKGAETEIVNALNKINSIKDEFDDQECKLPNKNGYKGMFVFLSNFSEAPVEEIFNVSGSYPLQEGQNFFYESDIIANKKLNSSNKSIFRDVSDDLWDLLYLYSGGDVFTLKFLYENRAKIDSNSNEGFAQLLDSFANKVSRELELVNIKNIKNIKDPFKVICVDSNNDSIGRMSLFMKCSERHHKIYYKPANYFYTYALNKYFSQKYDSLFINTSNMHPMNSRYLNYYSSLIEIEKNIKNFINHINSRCVDGFLQEIVFSQTGPESEERSDFKLGPQIVEFQGKTFIEQIPVDEEVNLEDINYKYRASNTFSVNKSFEIRNDKEWDDNPIKNKNIFSSLTLGTLEILLNVLNGSSSHNFKKFETIMYIEDKNDIELFFKEMMLSSGIRNEDIDLSKLYNDCDEGKFLLECELKEYFANTSIKDLLQDDDLLILINTYDDNHKYEKIFLNLINSNVEDLYGNLQLKKEAEAKTVTLEKEFISSDLAIALLKYFNKQFREDILDNVNNKSDVERFLESIIKNACIFYNLNESAFSEIIAEYNLDDIEKIYFQKLPTANTVLFLTKIIYKNVSKNRMVLFPFAKQKARNLAPFKSAEPLKDRIPNLNHLVNFIEKIRPYRNAFFHDSTISKQGLDNFSAILEEYYRYVSVEYEDF